MGIVTIDSMIRKLSEAELKEAFMEFSTLREIGRIKDDGIVRRIQREFQEQTGEISLNALEGAILWEIARQKFQKQPGESPLDALDTAIL